jgi:C-terminal processing protease CtpA/Prc
MLARPLAALAPGYRALPSAAPEFPIGLIDTDGGRVGVLKIGLFSAGGAPELCEAALRALAISPAAPCEGECRDRVDAWTANRMTEDLAASIEALRAAEAKVLLVDTAGNGGGSQWAEAAARMLSGKRLVSEQGRFVRGEHWIKRFTEDAAALRTAAAKETGADRAMLLELAAKIDAMRAEAATPCDASSLLEGGKPACAWLGRGYFGTGVLGSADPDRLRGKAWAASVFSPMEFPYREGVWRGPLIVLVDQDSASATAQFAAVLQDNHAAVIMGAPSDGGCGHTNGGTPTRLSHSKGILEVPDCARFRADGSNEVRGVQPDVLVGLTPKEGARLQAERLAARLPDAVRMASAQ